MYVGARMQINEIQLLYHILFISANFVYLHDQKAHRIYFYLSPFSFCYNGRTDADKSLLKDLAKQ